MTTSECPQISDEDLAQISELRSRLQEELKLMPVYDDDLSLQRWLVGWDRNVDATAPKLKEALRTLSALKMHERAFNSIEDVTQFCDSIIPHGYLPGSLLGHDKSGNIVSLVPIGRLDGFGLLKSTKVSDMFLAKVVESEGVMQLIRRMEKESGKQFGWSEKHRPNARSAGTTVIMDLDGLCRDAIDVTALKVITGVLARLQDLFPDVLRKAFVIRAPSFVQLGWSLVSPCLAKQTQQKIEFCGSNWIQRLKEVIDESVLYKHWGGERPSTSPTGHVNMGGKVPKDQFFVDDFDQTAEKLVVTVPARNMTAHEVEVTEPGVSLEWWFKCEGGDLDFWVERKAGKGVETDLVWPKFRLLTSFVPEHREISLDASGIYRLCFDNSHGKLFSKQVKLVVNLK